jgi:hypothetical protein
MRHDSNTLIRIADEATVGNDDFQLVVPLDRLSHL